MKSNFYTIYKTTNLINNKIYIGAHKTKNKDDKYMGSGVAISKAFEKYGKENFKKEILHLLNSEEEMYLKEKEIVNEEFIKLNTNYNLKLGGDGGFEHIDCSGENNCMKNSKTAKKVGNALKLKYLYDDEFASGLRERALKGLKIACELRKGQTDSEETKTKRNNTLKKTKRSGPKKYKLISPTGDIFMYSTYIECIENHNLNINLLMRWLNTGVIKQSNYATRISESAYNTYGWQIESIIKDSHE